MPHSIDIGARLREVRKRRGLSQRELATASHVSLSLIRKLEQGEVQRTRMETARLLAVALRVPTTTLMAERREDEADPSTVDLWEPVRRALAGTADDIDQPPTLDGVTQALNAALPLFSADRFAELGQLLPPLIRDAEVLASIDPAGRAVQTRLMQLVGWLLTQTRQFDAAETALDRALDGSVDRLQAAATTNTQAWLLLRRGQLADARILATRWADDIEPRMSKATLAELSAWGWSLLRVSAAAIRDNRPGEAEDAMRLARSAATAMGREYAPPEDFLRTFGPTTVVLKNAENAMVNDRPDRVLQLAGKVPPGGLRPTSNNWNRHRLDVAHAHVKRHQYAEAIGVLQEVWVASPQWLPNQRYARDIVGAIVAGRRTLTPEMRILADAVGTPL